MTPAHICPADHQHNRGTCYTKHGCRCATCSYANWQYMTVYRVGKRVSAYDMDDVLHELERIDLYRDALQERARELEQ